MVATDLSLWGPIVVLWEAERIPVALSSTFMGPLIPGPDAPAVGPRPARPADRADAALSRAAVDRRDRAGGPGLRRRVDEIRAEHGLAPLG